jgi:cullin 3
MMANFRKGLNVNDVDFETTWAVLEKAFYEIHTKNASALSFEELYRNAYKIVLKKKGEELYNKVAQFEAQWLSQNVRTNIVKHLQNGTLQILATGGSLASTSTAERRTAGENFLKALKQSWEDHQVCMGMLTDVLMYMVSCYSYRSCAYHVTDVKVKDRVYCTDHRQPSIFAKAMGLFRDQILRSPIGPSPNSSVLVEVLTSIILDQIQMDRDGEKIDQHLIKANVYMLEGLYDSDQEVEEEKLYLRLFEPTFLDSSADFYRAEGERLLKDSDAGTYCRQAKRRIDQENDRCRSTISESTTPKIQRVVEDELIRHKMKGLIEMDSGVQYMIDNDKFNELGLVFDLEARVDPTKPELTKAIQKIITEMGAEINNAALTTSQAPPAATAQDDGDEKQKAGNTRQINQQTVAALKWVEDILALKARFDNIWKTSFNSDQTISTALTRSMSDAINAFSRGSEYISLFIDENMKKGIRDKTEAEIDATLEQAITTLRYLQDKDIFETYYKKHLCKRLLLKKSQSIDVEKQMISRMKIELGNSFTLKLEAMFKDMTLSEELTSGYRTHISRLGQADSKRVDLSINVLTSMTWPLEAFRGAGEEEREGRSNLIFPGSIERIKGGFEKFYNEKYSGRKLTWQTNMGDADIKATFPKSRNGRPMTHDINCSTYGMLILLLFNELPANVSLTFEEIQAQTNIPESDLKRNLQSLAVAPKTRFLVKEPMSREINAGDKFSYNENFSSKIIKIKVGVVSAGNKVEGERERKETEKKNNDSRGFAIEAAVVRIMKCVSHSLHVFILYGLPVYLELVFTDDDCFCFRQRKDLPHAQLLTETITVLSGQFKPDVNMIKKRIESLIEREYLERVEDAPVPSYRYLA